MSQHLCDKFHTFSFFLPFSIYRQYFKKFLWHKNLNAISELICIEVAKKTPEAFVRPTGTSSSSSSLNDSITSLRFSLYCHALLKMMIQPRMMLFKWRKMLNQTSYHHSIALSQTQIIEFGKNIDHQNWFSTAILIYVGLNLIL